MSKISILIGIILLLGVSICFAQADEITFLTYYPSPYGVYGQVRLEPRDDISPAAACNTKGLIYYDDSDSQIYICNGTSWQKLGEGGFWSYSGTNIYNQNAGEVGINRASLEGGLAGDPTAFKLELSGGGILLDNDQALGSKLAGGGTAKMLFMSPSDNTYIDTPAGQDIYFTLGGAGGEKGDEVMVIDSSGDVGIGNISWGVAPLARLFVNKAGPYWVAFVRGGVDKMSLEVRDDDQFICADNSIYFESDNGTTNIVCKETLGTGIYGTLTVGDNYAEEESLSLPDNSVFVEKRVGIGTNSPDSPLHVVGKIFMTDVSGSPSNTVYNSDVAEDIFAPDALPGDVVVIDADNDQKVIKSSIAYDSKVAGIISESPGFLIGSGGEKGYKPLALAGRVYCKVTTENGPIKRGDLLVTSSKPGYAMRADLDKLGLGMALGKALEPLDKGEGKIMVLTTAQ